MARSGIGYLRLMRNPDYNTFWTDFKDTTSMLNPGLTLREVKITSFGKDPKDPSSTW